MAMKQSLKPLAAQLKAIAKKAFCVKRMTVGVSDNAEALATVRKIRSALEAEGVLLQHMKELI